MRSNNNLCSICRKADFSGMFTGRDYRNGFNPYRADLNIEKQVPRTWAHIRTHAGSCAFCRLTFRQIELFRCMTRMPGGPRKHKTFPYAGEDEMVIAVVEMGTGMFHDEFTHCIGFHNGTYRHPSHDKLMIRGLQLSATQSSIGSEWARVCRKMDRAKSAYASGTDKDLNLAFEGCFGGRLVGKDVDIKRCQEWLVLCEHWHKDCHAFKPVGIVGQPARVIDVRKGCLVSGYWLPDGYAALSYVWGRGKPGIQLTTTNEYQLREHGSLFAPGITLKRTISDAVEFCRRVGPPYLWVDQLCIPQDKAFDDPDISRMASIYSGAAWTLVPLSATSFYDPIPGVRPGTRNPLPQREDIVDNLRLMSCYPALFTEIENSVWFTRGWTLQEAAFSKRIVFFTKSQAFFLCREAMYCEESVWELPGGDATAASANTGTIEAGRIKDMVLFSSSPGSYPTGVYYRLVEEYTKRTLGNQSDILRAWSTVIQWVENDKEWGSACHFGLPLNEIGFGLGWQPIGGHNPCSRRDGFPSWSWAGWKGRVEWRLEAPYSRVGSIQTNGGGREDAWGRSGFVEETDVNRSLRKTYGKTIAPVRRNQNFPTLNLPILEFVTSSAYITVSRQSNTYSVPPAFSMLGSDGYQVGELECDPAWRASQPDKLKFIVFSAARLTNPSPPQYEGFSPGCGTSRLDARMSGRLYSNFSGFEAAISRWEDTCSRERFVLDLMCILIGDNGVGQRVQVYHGMSMDTWLGLGPREEFIRLG